MVVDRIGDEQSEDACADDNQRNGNRAHSLAKSVGVVGLRNLSYVATATFRGTCPFATFETINWRLLQRPK